MIYRSSNGESLFRSLVGMSLVFLLTGCGGFTSNSKEDLFTLVVPSHTNTTNVSVSGNCLMDLEDPSIILTGDFTEAPLTLTCVDKQYSGSITLQQAETQVEAAHGTHTAAAQIVLDTTAPVVNILTPANGSFVGIQVTVSGTCEAGLGVELSGDLQSTVNTTCTSQGQFSSAVQFNALPTLGARSLTALQTDLAGNTGSETFNYDFDNTVPGQPQLTLDIAAGNPDFPTNPTVSADITPTFTGTVADADGGLIEIFLDAQCSTPAIGSQTIPTGGSLNINNISFPNDGSADGLKRFYARVTGVNGVQNPGGCFNAMLSYHLDTTAPVITVVSPQNGQSYYAGSTLNFSGTCEAKTAVDISIAGGAPHTAPCPAGTFSASLTLPSASGASSAVFTQRDLANLQSQLTVNYNLSVGPPANPEVLILSPTAGSVIDVSAPITVTGTCTSHPSISSNVTFTGSLVGGPVTSACVSNGTTYGGTFSVDLQMSEVAAPTLTAKQESLESQAEYTSTVTYQVAPENPVLTLNVDAGHPTYTTTPPSSKDTTPTITGTVKRAAQGTLALYSDSTCQQLISSHNVPTNQQININNISYSNDGSQDGVKNFYAILTNTEGTSNPAGCSLVGSYRLDTTAPALTLTSHTSGATYHRSSSQTFTGTCETGAPIQLTLGAQSFQPTCSSGAFSQNIILPSTGNSVNLTLTQTDAANNSTEVSHSYNLETAPVSSIHLTFSTPAENSLVSVDTFTAISGECTFHADMSAVQLTGDIKNNVNATCVSDGTDYGGTFTANVEFNAISSPILNATQVNNFNSEQNSISRQFYVAPTDPVLALTTNPAGVVSKDTSPKISGTVNLANGGTIEIFEDSICAVLIESSTISSTGHIDLDLSYNNDGTDDGLHTYYAKVTSVNGSTNPSGCLNTGLSYTLDTIPPSLTLTSITEGATYDAGQLVSFQGACEINLPILFDIGGTAEQLTCTTTGTYVHSFNLPTALGNQHILFSQTDGAGNIAQHSRTVNIALPVPNPVNIVILSPANGTTVTHLMETTISGLCTYHPQLSGVHIQGDVVGNPITPCVSDGSATGGTFEMDVYIAATPTPSISAMQRNLSTNAQHTSAHRNYVLLNFDTVFSLNLDPGNPNIPSDPPASADTTPSITGTLPEAAGLDLELYNDALCTGSVIASQTVPQNGNIVLTANYSNDGSDDGVKSFYAKITQSDLGFESDCLDLEISYRLDTQAPELNLTSHSSGQSYVVSSNQTLAGSCESGLPVSLNVGGTSYTLTCSNSTFSQSVMFPSAPGSLAIQYSQTDAANNQTQKSLTLTIENLPPPSDPTQLEFDLVHGNANVPTTPLSSSQTNFVITGQAANAQDALVTLYADSACSGNPLTFTNISDPSGEFTLYVENESHTGQVLDGLHEYFIRITQGQVTNPSGCMNTGLSYILDTQAPEMLLQAPTAGSSFYATKPTVFSGLCESGAPVVITFNSAVAQTETIDCIDDAFSASVTLPADVGSMSFSISSADAAGNESGLSHSSINLTLPPPTTINLAVTSPASGSAVNAGTSTTITGQCTFHTEMSQVHLVGDIATPVSVNCITDNTNYGGTFTASVSFNDQQNLSLAISQTNNYAQTPDTETINVTYHIAPSDPVLNISLQAGNPNIPTPNPPHTAGATPQITGSVAKGAGGLIEIFADNTCNAKLGEATIASNESLDMNLNLTTDGLYELYALVTMPTSHTNTNGCHKTSISFVLDRVAPEVTLTSHDSQTHYLVGTTQDLAGTCEAGLPVQLTVGGASFSPACGSSGTFTQTVTFPSSAQSMLVSFAQTDAANNTGSGSVTLNVVSPPPSGATFNLVIADGNPLYEHEQTTPRTSKDTTPQIQGTVTDADGGYINIYSDSQCTQAVKLGTSVVGNAFNVEIEYDDENGTDDGLHEYFAVITANGQSTNCINTNLSYILDTTIDVTLDSFSPTNNTFYSGYRAFEGECSDVGTDVMITTSSPAGNSTVTTCNANNKYFTVIYLPPSQSVNIIDIEIKHDDIAGNEKTITLTIEESLDHSPAEEFTLDIDAGIVSLPVSPQTARITGRCMHGDLFSDVHVTIVSDDESYTSDNMTPCFAVNGNQYEGVFIYQIVLPVGYDSFDIELVQQGSIHPAESYNRTILSE